MITLTEISHAIKILHCTGGVPLGAGELQDVRELLRVRGHLRPPLQIVLFGGDILEVESMTSSSRRGSMFRHLRGLYERGIGPLFDPQLSMALDLLIQAEEIS